YEDRSRVWRCHWILIRQSQRHFVIGSSDCGFGGECAGHKVRLCVEASLALSAARIAPFQWINGMPELEAGKTAHPLRIDCAVIPRLKKISRFPAVLSIHVIFGLPQESSAISGVGLSSPVLFESFCRAEKLAPPSVDRSKKTS